MRNLWTVVMCSALTGLGVGCGGDDEEEAGEGEAESEAEAESESEAEAESESEGEGDCSVVCAEFFEADGNCAAWNGTNAAFEDQGACMADCEGGDAGCREYHVGVAADDADTHCPHAAGIEVCK